MRQTDAAIRHRVSTLDDLGVLESMPERGRVRIGVMRGEQLGVGTLEF